MDKYTINAPDVNAELFDHEILAINLKSGQYHSLRSTAVPFWQLITSGNTLDETVTKMAKAYTADATLVKKDFDVFLQTLLQHQLIKSGGSAPAGDEYLTHCTGEYEPPVLENYLDMKELLLMDPIHEVDVTGWPNKPKE